MVALLFDECLSVRIAKALDILGHEVYHVCCVSDLGSSAEDDQIIKWCRDKGAVLVTTDLSITRTREYVRLLKQGKVSAAFFHPPSTSGWDRDEELVQLLKRMQHMQTAFSKPGPVYYLYKSRGKPEKMRL